MNLFQIIAVFLGLMAVVGWANARTLRLPQSIAMMSAGIATAAVLFIAQTAVGPFWGFDSVRDEISRLNFSEAVVGYMLAFLLFSSGMQVDLGEFRRRRVAIWFLATLGVLISTGLVGAGVWLTSRVVGVNLPLPWALVFGALISPTDPVAVMGLARSGVLSKRLAAVLEGEALFNDGVGLVVFTAALAFAQSGVAPDPVHTAGAILTQAGGGLALGVAAGLLVTQVMRTIDDYVVELTASLALATGVYAIAEVAHVSGPVAASAAGLIIGSYGFRVGMSEEARRHIQGFWHLADELLNGLLFLLMGLQIFVVPFDLREIDVWICSIVLVAAARLVVVMPWGAYFHLKHEEKGASLILAWGGLRGGISLALALTLPPGHSRDLIVSITFAVVIVSVLVQGLTLGPIARWLRRGDPKRPV
jgi:CPA1 family monovalent cation:H+ antiporter